MTNPQFDFEREEKARRTGLTEAIANQIHRKLADQIKKEAGDWIKVVLYVDESELEIPKEFVECLKDEPQAWKNFKKLSESEKKKYIDWIYAVKTDELKVQRMADSINRIAKGEKWQR